MGLLRLLSSTGAAGNGHTALVMVTKAETAQLSTSSEAINKMGSIHPVKHHSAIRKSGVPGRAPAWMNPGNLMLSERYQSGDCSGGPVVKISPSNTRGYGFDPWSGSKDLT